MDHPRGNKTNSSSSSKPLFDCHGSNARTYRRLSAPSEDTSISRYNSSSSGSRHGSNGSTGSKRNCLTPEPCVKAPLGSSSNGSSGSNSSSTPHQQQQKRQKAAQQQQQQQQQQKQQLPPLALGAVHKSPTPTKSSSNSRTPTRQSLVTLGKAAAAAGTAATAATAATASPGAAAAAVGNGSSTPRSNQQQQLLQHRYSCQSISVTSSAAAQSLIHQGLRRRHTAATALNPDSSRSHALITITLQQLRPAQDWEEKQQQQQQQQHTPRQAAAAAAAPTGRGSSDGGRAQQRRGYSPAAITASAASSSEVHARASDGPTDLQPHALVSSRTTLVG